MDFLWDAITEWLKELLVGGITSNLSGMFDSVNQKVAEISGQVGMTPQGWNGSIYNMIHNLSETVIVPIAGVILRSEERRVGKGCRYRWSRDLLKKVEYEKEAVIRR